MIASRTARWIVAVATAALAVPAVAQDKTGQQPTLGHQVGAHHRISRPPVTIRVEVDVLAVRQRVTADS